MRLLRLVGPGDDGTSVLLETTDGAEQFTLPVDERFRAAARAELTRPIRPETTNTTSIRPRDIQIRVRAGEDPQDVADAAGITLERVMRFGYPVLQERSRVTDEAQRARARRNGEGPLLPFGELVDGRLADYDIEASDVKWDSFRREDGGWTVTAKFQVSEKELLAKFAFTLTNRTVTPLNELASDLLSDRPIRALTPEPEPLEDDPTDEAVGRLAAVPSPAEDEDEHGHDLGSSSAELRLPSRRQKAHTRSLPAAVDDELFDQDALDEPWRGASLPLDLTMPSRPAPASANRSTSRSATTAVPGVASRPEPPVARANPQPASEPSKDDADEPSSKRAGRKTTEKPKMPSWDDILLGVRHKSE
jgi:hypothetical protein